MITASEWIPLVLSVQETQVAEKGFEYACKFHTAEERVLKGGNPDLIVLYYILS